MFFQGVHLNWHIKAKVGTLVDTQQYSPDFVALLRILKTK